MPPATHIIKSLRKMIPKVIICRKLHSLKIIIIKGRPMHVKFIFNQQQSATPILRTQSKVIAWAFWSFD
uniref:Uncharacterized protein n=1 Tax=Rhizophora mucronata TaxID=61149 RepID=A0A2P2P8R1_RHIMU